MTTHMHDHVFAGGVDQHGNLIVKIGPGHLLARMNAVDRSRLISAAPALLEAMKGVTIHFRHMVANPDGRRYHPHAPSTTWPP